MIRRLATLVLIAATALGCTVHVHVTLQKDGSLQKDGRRRTEDGRSIPPPPSVLIPPPSPVHTGHFTVSYIEPKYPSPASAAVRDGLAQVKSTGIDTTYRSYTEGQTQLTTLGFTSHFTSADLPIVFLQEDGPTGAPIIGSLKSPASADAVVAWVREFRGP